MIVLFTDFGWHDPYVGQMKAVLSSVAPQVPVIDLLHAVPDFNAHSGAILLDALAFQFPVGTVFLCVVDPGVGGPRQALVVEADGRFFVGPDNGLLTVLSGRASTSRYWRLDWRPDRLSASFHGRDLFAPIAAQLALSGALPESSLSTIDEPAVRFDTADLPRIVYIDHYGNAWTGLRAGLLDDVQTLEVKGSELARREVFYQAERGEAFWYVNSVGLAEIAVNRGNAADTLGIRVGDMIRLQHSTVARH